MRTALMALALMLMACDPPKRLSPESAVRLKKVCCDGGMYPEMYTDTIQCRSVGASKFDAAYSVSDYQAACGVKP